MKITYNNDSDTNDIDVSDDNSNEQNNDDNVIFTGDIGCDYTAVCNDNNVNIGGHNVYEAGNQGDDNDFDNG